MAMSFVPRAAPAHRNRHSDVDGVKRCYPVLRRLTWADQLHTAEGKRPSGDPAVAKWSPVQVESCGQRPPCSGLNREKGDGGEQRQPFQGTR